MTPDQLTEFYLYLFTWTVCFFTPFLIIVCTAKDPS
jgi:hypothetical protein